MSTLHVLISEAAIVTGSLNLKTGCAAVGSNICNQAFVKTDAVTQLQLHASFTCLFHCEEVSADPEQ